MLKRQSSSPQVNERCPSSVAATYRYDLSDWRYIPKSAHCGGPIVRSTRMNNPIGEPKKQSVQIDADIPTLGRLRNVLKRAVSCG